MGAIHSWDLIAAPKASAREIVSKMKKGWQLKRLAVSYCSAGGCGTYIAALISPDGEIRQVTDHACLTASVEPEGELGETCDAMVLVVPFGEKEAVKSLGAHWVPKPVGAWCIKVADAERFIQWLPVQPRLINTFTLEPVG